MDSLDTYGKHSEQNLVGKSLNSGSVSRSPIENKVFNFEKGEFGNGKIEDSRSLRDQNYYQREGEGRGKVVRSHKDSLKGAFTDRFETQRVKKTEGLNEYSKPRRGEAESNRNPFVLTTPNKRSNLDLQGPQNQEMSLNMNKIPKLAALQKRKSAQLPSNQNYFKPSDHKWASQNKINIYNQESRQKEESRTPTSVPQSLSYIKSLEKFSPPLEQNIYFKQEAEGSLYGPQQKFKVRQNSKNNFAMIEHPQRLQPQQKPTQVRSNHNSKSNLVIPIQQIQQMRHQESEDFKIEPVSSRTSRRNSKALLISPNINLQMTKNQRSQQALIELNTEYINNSFITSQKESQKDLIEQNSDYIKHRMQKYNTKYMASHVLISEDSDMESESERVIDSEQYMTNSTLQSDLGAMEIGFDPRQVNPGMRNHAQEFRQVENHSSHKHLPVGYDAPRDPGVNYDFNKSKKLNVLEFEAAQDPRLSNLEIVHPSRQSGNLQIPGSHMVSSPRLAQGNLQRYNTTNPSPNAEGNFYGGVQVNLARPGSSPMMMSYEHAPVSPRGLGPMQSTHMQPGALAPQHMHPNARASSHIQGSNLAAPALSNRMVYNNPNSNLRHPQANSFENLSGLNQHYQLYPPQNTPRQGRNIPAYGNFYPNNLYQKQPHLINSQIPQRHEPNNNYPVGVHSNYNLNPAGPNPAQHNYNLAPGPAQNPKPKRRRRRRAKNRKKTLSMGGESSELNLHKLNQKILRKRQKKRYARNQKEDGRRDYPENYQNSSPFERKASQGAGYY